MFWCWFKWRRSLSNSFVLLISNGNRSLGNRVDYFLADWALSFQGFFQGFRLDIRLEIRLDICLDNRRGCALAIGLAIGHAIGLAIGHAIGLTIGLVSGHAIGNLTPGFLLDNLFSFFLAEWFFTKKKYKN
jgi:hypothetical protein